MTTAGRIELVNQLLISGLINKYEYFNILNGNYVSRRIMRKFYHKHMRHDGILPKEFYKEVQKNTSFNGINNTLHEVRSKMLFKRQTEELINGDE